MSYQGFFVVFVLILTLGLEASYRVFREHFSPEDQLRGQIESLHEDRERDQLSRALVQAQLEDLQAQAFQSFGEKKVLSWQEKQWLTSLRAPASEKLDIQSGPMLNKAKELFRKQKYEGAALQFEKFIETFPTSADIVEAHFLLAESLYLSGKVEKSLDWIDQMMTRYPESELTGFALVRMGSILEKRNQHLEALEIYETVRREFPHSRSLQSQLQNLQRSPASL